ncbi:MAG: phospho-N-acetylmuramoyl-pentapeptide-transferase [Lachnospiraceae bacterium]|jgi:phospho-N-acetylmuramoyl-pentapeptide-transferase|nr:phospho-N-acetylmuramoyl-pentapeptide-transferase [Lachnospiraceae bacterium]
MDFHILILLITFGISVVTAIITIPILRKLKIGQFEREDGPESHLNKKGTPTMGGIIMLIAIIIASVIAYVYYYRMDPDTSIDIAIIAASALGFFIIGFIDDYKKVVLKDTKGLLPIHKLLGLLIISVLVIIHLALSNNFGTEIFIPILKQYIILPIWAYIPFSILVFLGTTNAVNLTDGVDGLATSIVLIISTCLAVIGILFESYEVAIFGSIVVGACLGFLIFNLHKAKVFMGDSGSLMLGGVVALLSIYLKMPLIMLIVALIPVLEAISVILQVVYFKKTGKRIFKMAPLHHHFELSGWNENKVVSVFCVITLVLCIIAIICVI